jgi:hypothetical protein
MSVRALFRKRMLKPSITLDPLFSSIYKSDYRLFSDHQRKSSNMRQYMLDHNHEDHIPALGVRFSMESQKQADFRDWSSSMRITPRADATPSHVRPFAYLNSLRVTGDTQYDTDCKSFVHSSRTSITAPSSRSSGDTFGNCQGGVPRFSGYPTYRDFFSC